MKKICRMLVFILMVLASMNIVKMDITTAQASTKKKVIIEIGKTKIYDTSENIVEGENWKYEKATNTLTISNLDLSNGVISSNKKLKIKASGTNKIKEINVETWDEYVKGDVLQRHHALTIVGDENASITSCHIGSCSNLAIKNMSMADCSIHAGHVLNITDSYLSESRLDASGLVFVNSAIETKKIEHNVFYTSEEPGRYGLTIKNSTIKIDASGMAAIQLYGGKCMISDSTLDITAKEAGLYLDAADDVIIKNSNLKLHTTGTWGCPLYIYDSYDFEILNSKLTLTGQQCALYTTNSTTLIKNSTLDITSKTGMGVELTHGDDIAHTFTVENGNMNISAAKEGIYSEGVKMIFKSGKLNVSSKKKSGILMCVQQYADPEIQPGLAIKGGACNINGKKYGIHFITESKLELTGGTLTLNGDAAAVNMVSKLPTGKAYAIKAGSSKNKAKNSTICKQTDKYVCIKKNK